MNIVENVKQLLPYITNAYTKDIPISEVAEGLSIKDEALATWEASVEAGKECVVGESVGIQEYLRKNTAPMSLWFKAAYDWAIHNPGWILALVIKVPQEDSWEEIVTVGKHGEYVVFYIENTSGGAIWISRDNTTQILVYRD